MAMRYKAMLYRKEMGETGIPAQTLGTDYIRCDVRAKRVTEVDDEDTGVYSLSYFELKFWKRSADAKGIKAGSLVQIDNVIYKILGTKPAGMGLSQYLMAEAEVTTDD